MHIIDLTQKPTESDEINGILSSQAYRDPAHPHHVEIKGAVAQWFEVFRGTSAHVRRPAPVVIDSGALNGKKP